MNPEPALPESGDCEAGAVNRDALARRPGRSRSGDDELQPAIGGPGLLHSPDSVMMPVNISGDPHQERVVTERAALDHGPARPRRSIGSLGRPAKAGTPRSPSQSGLCTQ